MKKSISKKIALLNKTTLDSMTEMDYLVTIKKFTENGLQILEADFGFAWWKMKGDDHYQLAYKSKNTPYEPNLPREKGGNFQAQKNKAPVFVTAVKKENYEEEYDVSPYMKSYVIIPITYKNDLYGNIVICYKNKQNFTKEDRDFAIFLGNSAAQSITIHQLVEKERNSLILAEKQKETEVLLSQEKLKTEFIANATHELRTPLAIMKGNLDLALMKEDDPKPMKTALHKIDTEIKHLSNIIEDLALLTSGEKVKEAIVSKLINICSLIENVADRLRALSYKNNMIIKIIHEQGCHLWVTGDEIYLGKLFTNIVKNAISYSKEKGQIFIEINKNKNMAQIKITDDGIGISKEDLPKVFERFYRTEDARMIRKKGTGLGLPISKWITETHGGKITVHSVLGKGTTFTVELPLAKT